MTAVAGTDCIAQRTFGDLAHAGKRKRTRREGVLDETINELCKAEGMSRPAWMSLQDVELAALDGLNWFNHRRLLGSIGNIPSAQAEVTC